MNAESNLITGLEVSSGNAWDGKHFSSLVEMDIKQGLPVEIGHQAFEIAVIRRFRGRNPRRDE